jgi:hypothetical protein
MLLCINKCLIFPSTTTRCYAQFLLHYRWACFTHSSSLNFYKSKENKHQQNLKCHNRDGGKMQMKLECK